MLNFLSSMLCTFNVYPFSLGNYLGTSLIVGNMMMIRVTSVEWMIRVRVVLCLICCLVLMVIEYHQYLCALSCILAVSNSITSRKHGKNGPQLFSHCGTFDHPRLRSHKDYKKLYFILQLQI